MEPWSHGEQTPEKFKVQRLESVEYSAVFSAVTCDIVQCSYDVQFTVWFSAGQNTALHRIEVKFSTLQFNPVYDNVI